MKLGQKVKITGGMKEFVGRTGIVAFKEDGLYRVRLDEPVNIPGIGIVRDDLWGGSFLKRIR